MTQSTAEQRAEAARLLAPMANSMLCRFAALRVVPDPLRGECVNVGMALFAVDGSFAACRLTDDWSRADALCGGDSSRYQEIARQDYANPINAGTFTLADFDRLRGNWGPYTTVGLTEGGASVYDNYADVLEEMYGMFVAFPPEGRYGARLPRQGAPTRKVW